MGSITVNYDDAISNINGIKNKTESNIESLIARYNQIETILCDSESDYITELKEYIKCERNTLNTLSQLLSKLCRALEEAVDGYRETDESSAASVQKKS